MIANTAIVTGSKGGVGTTTVALNLAVQLASQTQKRVLLIDLARPIGQVALMLDSQPRFTVLDVLERIDRLEERLLVSMVLRHKTGIDILAGPQHALMKPEQRQSVTLQAIRRLVEIAGRAFDFVIIDIGVVNAAEWAPVLSEAESILLVVEPTPLSLAMVDSHLAAAGASGVAGACVRVVANRCRQSDDGALADFERNHGQTVLSRLPNDYRQLTEAVKLGMPVTGSSNNQLLARYKDLATWLAEQSKAPAASAQ